MLFLKEIKKIIGASFFIILIRFIKKDKAVSISILMYFLIGFNKEFCIHLLYLWL